MISLLKKCLCGLVGVVVNIKTELKNGKQVRESGSKLSPLPSSFLHFASHLFDIQLDLEVVQI